MVFVKFIFTEMMFDGHDDPFFKRQISFFDEQIHSGKAIQGYDLDQNRNERSKLFRHRMCM